MSAIYNILDKVPAITSLDIQVEYEKLVQELVNSGRMRIDTDTCCNFARFSDPRMNVSLMISKQEITDPKLIPITHKTFKNIYKATAEPAAVENKIALIFKDLQKQINKLLPINPDLMVKLARIFVQSAHPIVIKWLLHDRVEVFITYSHNIGDMMDIVNWKHSGTNSGMQSTDGKNVAIFVSCGGDPLASNSAEGHRGNDGWPALARMQIIAGQELGHFADIKRDSQGRQIGRHSANFSGTAATLTAKAARKNDMANCDKLLQTLLSAGLSNLIKQEEKLKFYAKNKIGSFSVFLIQILKYIYKQKLLIYIHNNNLNFLKRFRTDEYMGLMIQAMILDMQANLNPVADVYKRENKEEEEAIACIEALARVPQQVMKWGYLTTAATMQGLYRIYYNEVIPSLIKNYEALTNQAYLRDYSYPKKTFLDYLSSIFKKSEPKPCPIREV